MTIVNGYCLAAEVQERAGLAATINVDAAVNAASRGIDTFCGRTFTVPTAATVRVFRASSCELLDIDDLASTTGLIVKTDDDDSGTFETTWASTDYELLPLNQQYGSVAGHAYTQVQRVGDRTFPHSGRRARVQVTGRWGWAAIPATIRAVCIDVAARGASGATGVRSETVGGYSVSYGASSGGASVWLADSEMAALAPFQKFGIA